MNKENFDVYLQHIAGTNAPAVMMTKYKKVSILKYKISEHYSENEFFHIDGSNLKNWEEFSSTMARHFKFPSYYGENWNAFNDCITDLDWLSFSKLFILITSSELVLKKDKKDLEVFERSINSAQEYWREPYKYDPLWPEGKSIPFHVLLVTDSKLVGLSCPQLKL